MQNGNYNQDIKVSFYIFEHTLLNTFLKRKFQNSVKHIIP